ncbi:hypothetical protein ACO0QE_002857 [Hanseniaspora vineae]
MDYAYEPTVDDQIRENSDKNNTGNSASTIMQDAKTEETFSKLEQKLDQSFTKTTNFLYNLWNEDQHVSLFREEDKPGPANSKTPSDDDSSDGIVTRGERAAQNVLDAFDTKLQAVEDFVHSKDQQQKAAENATRLIKSKWTSWSTGLTQFSESLKTKLNDISDVIAFPENEEHERVVTERLKVLGSDENVYLNYKGDVKDCKYSNDDISREVARDINLKVLVDSLVAGNKIDYKTFWAIYFIKKQELLEASSQNNESEKSALKTNLPSWDDEEEEEEEEDETEDRNNNENNTVSDSSNEPFENNDIRLESRESMVIVNKGKDNAVENSATAGQSESQDSEDDDDDEEWQ